MVQRSRGRLFVDDGLCGGGGGSAVIEGPGDGGGHGERVDYSHRLIGEASRRRHNAGCGEHWGSNRNLT